METNLAVKENVAEEGLSIRDKALGIAVTDEASFETADNLYGIIKAGVKEVRVYFAVLKDNANKVHKDICTKEKAALTPFMEAEAHVVGQMKTYQVERDRKRHEEEERLRKEVEEAQLKAAQEAEAQGKEDVAEAILEAAMIAPPVYVPPAPKASNAIFKKEWRWELIDISQVPDHYKMLNEVAINGVVRSLKSATNIPGIRVYEDIGMASKARR